MLHPLLEYLSAHQPAGSAYWHAWTISRVLGGANNLLFRATSDAGDFAIKFTIRDQRERASREYDALRVLAAHDLHIAPAPVLLDCESYPQPVVVQQWLSGEMLAAAPTADDNWRRLIAHYATIHSVTPATTTLALSGAVLTARSGAACRTLIDEQMALLPREAWPTALPSLIERLEAVLSVDWPEPAVALCRVDANTSNFIRRSGAWASVDWENSGWGDPAFEIAELLSHPAYAAVAPARLAWVIDHYCRRSGAPDAAIRIGVYYRTMLVWWVCRLARTLYDVPRGLDRRLVERPAGWEKQTSATLQHYLRLAEALLPII